MTLSSMHRVLALLVSASVLQAFHIKGRLPLFSKMNHKFYGHARKPDIAPQLFAAEDRISIKAPTESAQIKSPMDVQDAAQENHSETSATNLTASKTELIAEESSPTLEFSLGDYGGLFSDDRLSATTEATTTTEAPVNFKFLSVGMPLVEENKNLDKDQWQSLLESLKPKLDNPPSDDAVKQPQPARAGLVSQIRPYIVGGEEASIRQFPWQAGIVVDRRNFCGGSLITTSHVLTAAHCTDVFMSFTIHFGGSKLPPAAESTRLVVPASKKIVHPDWSPADMSNDISILVLAKPLAKEQSSGPFVSIVRLPALSMTEETFEGKLSNISGWGLNATGGSLTKVLNFINVTVVPSLECAEAYGEIVESSTLCCVAPPGKATCQGDSGGPLVTKEADKRFTQIGIVSFGPSVCGEGPLGFTRVTSYLGWISDVAGIALRKSVV